MDIDKAMEFIKNSFLAPLLEIPHVTDISYNGATLFYVTNDQGRKRYEGEICQRLHPPNRQYGGKTILFSITIFRCFNW